MTYFNQIAAEFDAEPKRVELASVVGDAMIAALSPSAHWQVMDYGAGTGLLTLKLQPFAASIMAVDTSPNMLGVLKEKIERVQITNIQTHLWNVESDPLLPSFFDAIAGSMVMHHIPDTQGAMNRFYEMIVPGGRIALADLDAEEGDFHPPEYPVPHNGFERTSFADCLAKAGFRNIQFSTVHRIQKPTAAGVLKEYSLFLAVAVK